MDYSLEERVIGKWVDDRPVYEQTIIIPAADLPSLSSSGWKNGVVIKDIGTELYDNIFISQGFMRVNWKPTGQKISYTLTCDSIDSGNPAAFSVKDIKPDSQGKLIMDLYNAETNPTYYTVISLCMVLRYTKESDITE